jgi:hypothetical protein
MLAYYLGTSQRFAVEKERYLSRSHWAIARVYGCHHLHVLPAGGAYESY